MKVDLEGIEFETNPLFASEGEAWMELLGDCEGPLRELRSMGIYPNEAQMQADIRRLFREVYLPCVRKT